MRLTSDQSAMLERDPWFGRVPPARRAALLDAATLVHRPEGARVYATGDPPNGLWGVLEGRIRLLDFPMAGAEVLIRALEPGAWFGELSMLDGGPRPQDAVAAGPTALLHVSVAAFARLADATPAFHLDLALLGCAHQRAALAFIGQRVARPVPARVAWALLDAAPQDLTEPLPVRQAELAIIVGVSRQTLNRILKRFEHEGAVRTGYGRIQLLDRARLEALSRAAHSPTQAG